MLASRNYTRITAFFFLCTAFSCNENPASNDFNKKVVEDLHAGLSSIYPNNLYVQYSMEGRFIPDSIVVTDLNGGSKKLKDVVNRPRLIMRFSDINCNTCVDQEINNMRKFFPSPKNEEIMILATYRSVTDLLKFKRINAIDFELYSISENQLPLAGEQISTPYMFVVDKSLQVKFPFIPSKEFPDCSLSYYKALLESNIF